MTRSRRTGFLWHELYAWYEASAPSSLYLEPTQSLESAESKRRFRNLLDVSGLLEKLETFGPVEADDEALLRVHAPAYLAKVEALSSGEGGDAGKFAYVPKRGMRILRLSAGGAIRAVDAVLDGEVDNFYALSRPPGHHARQNAGMGYCIFNNVAIAAAHARARKGVGRIAIVDWDVHHGNGTQEIFWNDPDVLTISLHQDGLFTLSDGGVHEVGGPDAKESNINVPLPAGSGHGAYLAAMHRVVVPALRKFRPDVILVASGLDAGFRDPLGRMMLHSDSYREMTAVLMEAADELCDGRLVLVHEGGYSPTTVPFAGLAILEQLSGSRTPVEDPFVDSAKRIAGQELQPFQNELLASIAARVGLPAA